MARPVPIVERPDLLEVFRKSNPHLTEDHSYRRCVRFHHLLSLKHRTMPDCCYQNVLRGQSVPLANLDEFEQWRDGPTGLPVALAHVPVEMTDYRPAPHDLEMLREIALWYILSDGSWRHDGGRLLMVARLDVLERSHLPLSSYLADVPALVSDQMAPPDLDVDIIEAAKVAAERIQRNRIVEQAKRSTENGDYQLALYQHCMVAYGDRSGNFHRQAKVQIEMAGALVAAHPELDLSACRFSNEQDRQLVCGEVSVRLSRPALQRRLDQVPVPEGWLPFVVRESYEAYAQIPNCGFVTITQGGHARQWNATLEVTSENSPDVPYSTRTRYPTPEGAVEAGVELWRRYVEAVAMAAESAEPDAEHEDQQ